MQLKLQARVTPENDQLRSGGKSDKGCMLKTSHNKDECFSSERAELSSKNLVFVWTHNKSTTIGFYTQDVWANFRPCPCQTGQGLLACSEAQLDTEATGRVGTEPGTAGHPELSTGGHISSGMGHSPDTGITLLFKVE